MEPLSHGQRKRLTRLDMCAPLLKAREHLPCELVEWGTSDPMMHEAAGAGLVVMTMRADAPGAMYWSLTEQGEEYLVRYWEPLLAVREKFDDLCRDFEPAT